MVATQNLLYAVYTRPPGAATRTPLLVLFWRVLEKRASEQYSKHSVWWLFAIDFRLLVLFTTFIVLSVL